MRFFPSFLVACALAAVLHTPARAQEELRGDENAPSKSWGMLAYQRTWTPQKNNYPNAGFGFQVFQSVEDTRTWWVGLGIMGSGLERRDVLAIAIGPGAYFLGSARFGGFAFAQLGMSITSKNGITNFNFIGDPSTAIGLGVLTGVGMSFDVFKFLRMHAALVGNVYTVDGGHTPFGFQVGITSGGK